MVRPSRARRAVQAVLTREGRRGFTAIVLAAAALTLLTACTLEPRLTTSADDLQGATYEDATITLRNAGGGTLHWEFTTDNPHVSLRDRSDRAIAGGSLAAGGSTTLHIAVQGRVAAPGASLHANLEFRSNGGSLTVPYAAGSENVDVCPALPASTLTTSGARSAGAHVDAVPVGTEILVSYRLDHAVGLGPGALEAQAAHTLTQLTSEHGLTTLEAAWGLGPDLLAAPAGADVDALVTALAADPRVKAVQRNYYLAPQWNGGAPTDPHYGAQWALSAFGVPEAWAALTDAPQRDVVIAVLDTGVDGEHPDLAAKMLPGFDFYRNTDLTDPAALQPGRDTYTKVAHGTHVAGIAAATSDDVGMVGVAFAPEVQILPVKLFDDCGQVARVDTLIKAVRWAAALPVAGAPANANKAHIINMSLGVAGRHPVLDEATTEAANAGVLVIAAAGNHGVTNGVSVLSPANGPSVLAVGSVNQNRERSSFSNYGPELDVVAPGGYADPGSAADALCGASTSTSVLSTVPRLAGGSPEQDYACFAGTSMAAPFVAGVAALLLAQDATLNAADVSSILVSTALLEPHMSSHPQQYGAGLVCADAALGAPTRCGAP